MKSTETLHSLPSCRSYSSLRQQGRSRHSLRDGCLTRAISPSSVVFSPVAGNGDAREAAEAVGDASSSFPWPPVTSSVAEERMKKLSGTKNDSATMIGPDDTAIVLASYSQPEWGAVNGDEGSVKGPPPTDDEPK